LQLDGADGLKVWAASELKLQCGAARLREELIQLIARLGNFSLLRTDGAGDVCQTIGCGFPGFAVGVIGVNLSGSGRGSGASGWGLRGWVGNSLRIQGAGGRDLITRFDTSGGRRDGRFRSGRREHGFGRAGFVPLLHLIHAFFHIGELLLNLLEAVGFSGRAALTGIGEKFVADEGDTDDGDRENYQAEGARLLRRRLFGRCDECLPVKIDA
jgi:hypothetical protein